MKKLDLLLIVSIFCILTESICSMEESKEDTLDRTDYKIGEFLQNPEQQTIPKALELIATIQEEQTKYFHQTSSTRTNFQNMIVKNIEKKIRLLQK